jgi:hypothetical protein
LIGLLNFGRTSVDVTTDCDVDMEGLNSWGVENVGATFGTFFQFNVLDWQQQFGIEVKHSKGCEELNTVIKVRYNTLDL